GPCPLASGRAGQSFRRRYDPRPPQPLSAYCANGSTQPLATPRLWTCLDGPPALAVLRGRLALTGPVTGGVTRRAGRAATGCGMRSAATASGVASSCAAAGGGGGAGGST